MSTQEEASVKASTQKERLLTYAQWQGQIGFTRFDALAECGIFELASRIGELEREGHSFERSKQRVGTRYGGFVTVTRYAYKHGEPEVA